MCLTWCLSIFAAIDHQCNESGCGRTLVLDGNMKNHRDVCAAKEAGYAEFDGLPGKIKTGCTNTPQLKSRYCPPHTPTVVKLQKVDMDEHASSSTKKEAPSNQEDQIAYIVGKKTTRQNTFYEVCSLCVMQASVCLLVGTCTYCIHVFVA